MRVKLLEENKVDTQKLAKEILELRDEYPEFNQFCITSITGDDDLFKGTGGCWNNKDHNKLNRMFKGTYIEELVDEYNEFYRWRILCLPQKTTYTIHKDSMDPGYQNIRLHIPVITNPNAYLMFFEHEMEESGKQNIEYHNLKAGNIYLVDTTHFHTGVNYDHDQERIHIVAERFIPYE